MKSLLRSPKHSRHRSGSQIVEVAACLPIFVTVLFGLFECGHVFLVVHTLSSSAQTAARYGSTPGITSAQVTTNATNLIKAMVRASASPTVLVKDGSLFETPNVNPSTINYSTLPNIELSTATTDQLYIVRVTIPYDSVSLAPTKWVKGKTLSGQAVMRHE